MIPEKIIDAAIESMGTQNEDGYERFIKEFETKQPVVLGYLFSDNMKLLTEKERNLLLYIVMVIRKSYLKTHNGQEPSPVSPDQLGEAEDKNWSQIEELQHLDFRKKLDVFFEKTPQEDLLAFVEDILSDDDEEIITKTAREYIFIAAKTIVDVWC